MARNLRRAVVEGVGPQMQRRADRQSAAPNGRPDASRADAKPPASSRVDSDDAVGHRTREQYDERPREATGSRTPPRPVSSAELNRRLAEARRILKTQPPPVPQPEPAGAPVEAADPVEPPQAVAAAHRAEPGRAPRRLPPAVAIRTGLGLLIAAVVASAGVFLIGRQSSDEPRADRGPAPSTQSQPSGNLPVLAWLDQNTAPGAAILVPNVLLDRARDILHGRQVKGYYQLGAERPDLLVTRPGLRNVGASLRAAAASAPVVASLGDPPWQVRDMTGGGADEASARQAAGGELLENPALAFSGAASAALLAGELDSRLLVLLSGLATQADLVIDLPADSATTTTAPGRVIWVRSIDGEDAATSTVGRVTVNQFVNKQSGPLAASSGQITEPSGQVVLAVLVPLPAPTGLLGGAGMPTADEPPEVS